MRLAQEGKFCDLVSDGRARLDVEEFVFPSQEEWTNWYEHAEPVVKVFQQDKAARLAAGETLSFINLIQAGSSEAEVDAVKLVPVSETAAIVEADGEEMLFGVGNLPGDLGSAGAYALSSASGVIAGLTRLGSGDEPPLASSMPVDLHFGAGITGKEHLVTLLAGQPTAVEVTEPVSIKLAGEEQALDLPPGRHELAQAELANALSALLKSCIAGAREEAVAYRAAAAEEEEQPAFGIETHEVNLGTRVADMMAADLDGDGNAEWIVVGEEGATAVQPDGTRLWQFATEKPCRALDAGDLDGDGKLEWLRALELRV